MSKPIHITSSSHFRTITSSSTFVIVDFYADWCGPCKAIAPVFDQLAQAESKPGKLAFVKVDVDSQQDIAQTYGVSAMPTFLIIKNGTVSKTIRGADPSGLRSAVQAAASEAGKGPAKSSAAFQSQGHVLGSSGSSSTRTAQGPRRAAPSSIGTGSGFMDTATRFVALYFTTLFSLDANAAAEASPYSVGSSAARAR